MDDKVIASFSCSDCGAGTFHLIQIENELNTLCCKCGHVANMEDVITQLRNAKNVLDEPKNIYKT